MDVISLRARYLTQPHEVSIETLALCNGRCTFCPYPSLDRIGAKLPDAVLTDLIEQMSSWKEPFFISPFKVNEPLLDDRLEEFCLSVVERVPKARLRIFTNGQPLAARQIEWIGKLPPSRLSHLWISLNSTDAQEYGELMGLSYAIVANRLDALHASRLKGTFQHTVMLSRVAQDSVYSDRAGTFTCVGERDRRFLRDCDDHWSLFHPFLIKRDGWLGHVDPTEGQTVPGRGCGRWFELSITATGTVSLCCMDGKEEFKLGSIYDESSAKEGGSISLLEIYNQPYLRQRREFAVTREGIEPCQRCTY